MLGRAIIIGVALAVVSACNVISSSLLTGGSGDGSGPSDAKTGSSGPSDSSVTPPTNGLVLDYEFEDATGATVTDSARGLNASLTDPTMWTAGGRDGYGISMNGATPAAQFVSLPNDVLLGVGDFTISAWVKLNSNPAWARIYDIGNGQPDPANRFMYLTTSGFPPGGSTTSDGVHVDSYGGSTTDESTLGSLTFLPLDVWKHVTVTGTGGDRTIYIDGFPAAELQNGPAIAPSEMEPIAPNSWIGKSRFATDPGFPGMMDEFKIYSRVLTASEIEDLAWPKMDYAYWRFDESSGDAAKDSSDHALATALANGATWTTGRLGGAVGFAGGAAGSSSQHVVISGNPLAGCTSQFGIAAWIRINAYATNAKVFDFGSSNTDLYLAPNDGTGMHVELKSPSGTIDLITAAPPVPADSTWHHVAVTMDAGNIVVLYVDGAPATTQASSTVKPGDFANTTQAYLARSRGNDPFFNGAIDELRVSCRAFTSDEIKNLSHP